MPDKNIEKLKKLLVVLNTKLSKEDTVKALQMILFLLIKTEEDNQNLAKGMKEELLKKIGDKGDALTDEKLLVLIKPLIKEPKDGKSPTKEELLRFIWPLIPKVKDGETPTDEKLLKLIKPFIPLIPKVKDGYTPKKGIDYFDGLNGLNGSPDTAIMVRDKLEILKGDERLDISAIKELENKLKELEEIAKRPRGTIGGMRKITYPRYQNLTSQCNGILKAFILDNDTIKVLGVFGTQFPINFDPLTDWIFSGRTLTLCDSVSAPATGQTLWVLTEVMFFSK